MKKKDFRNEVVEIADSLLYEIAQIVPEDGIVFTPSFRDDIEKSDQVIPSVFVLEDDGECATLQDIYKITRTEYSTLDGGMIPLRSLPVDDLVNIYEYLTDVYVPATKYRYEATFYMLRYDYKKQAWDDTDKTPMYSDAGAWSSLQECIDMSQDWIRQQIKKDGDYRYVCMEIYKIDKDGEEVPNSTVYAASIFNGDIVRHCHFQYNK